MMKRARWGQLRLSKVRGAQLRSLRLTRAPLFGFLNRLDIADVRSPYKTSLSSAIRTVFSQWIGGYPASNQTEQHQRLDVDSHHERRNA